MYRPDEIEPKWQKRWKEEGVYKTEEKGDKQKFYCLDMFPYPSGAGLHVGHLEGYTATDVYSRYKRAQGFNVLHPMGWDAFGLPAENFAIKKGIHPSETTQKAIDWYKSQLNMVGLSYDWSREINTSDPNYYKWTQWLFLLLFKHGLAYKKEAPVNWCPSCQTVLANEQVVKKDDKNVCERCDAEVIQKNLDQWFLKITDYADRLLSGFEDIDWPASTREGQKNWIGRQEGAKIKWKIFIGDSDKPAQSEVETFTKYPETIFGTTFLAIAPEHTLIGNIVVTGEQNSVNNYIKVSAKKTNFQRGDLLKDKTGVFTGSFALNPANGKKIPIWVADYVLPTYGTGAVFGVPAHDKRDFNFAKKYNIEIE